MYLYVLTGGGERLQLCDPPTLIYHAQYVRFLKCTRSSM